MQGIFLGTFLIGLREGLEATLIVGIVAAFLKRNGHSLRPMVAGVGLAVAISVGVGVGLDLFSAALPQAQQEMLETVIGVVAVVFVTTMIMWMNHNASHLKGELESEAQQALDTGSPLALAGMAFLAVLKEGFETAVFLLAAIQATSGSWILALGGAVVGILVAIGIGVAIYVGGVRLNLSRFFRITGVFLILVAAGLVMSALRTAHEAGWVVIGQQRVADLSSWMPSTSVLGALLTGMFGIQQDPRLIEVLGWVMYVVPVLVLFLWPARLTPAPQVRRRILTGLSAGLVVVAAGMATLIPAHGAPLPAADRTLRDASGAPVHVTLGPDDGGTRTLTVDSAGTTRTVPLRPAGQRSVDEVPLDVWQTKQPADPGITATQVSLGELAALTGGRLPVGLTAERTPGPFSARWSASTVWTVLASGDALVGAEASSTRVATLTGGGLADAKTISLGGLDSDWAVSAEETAAAADTVAAAASDAAERMLWRAWVPVVLLLAAAGTAGYLVRDARRRSTAPDNTPVPGNTPAPDSTPAHDTTSSSNTSSPDERTLQHHEAPSPSDERLVS